MTFDVVFAIETQSVTDPTTHVRGVVRKGSHWPADDPVVRQHPDLFSRDPRWGLNYSKEPPGWDAPIEQATAGPGERRSLRPRVDDDADEAEGLRDELVRLGVKVDGRWSLNRLREELEKVGG